MKQQGFVALTSIIIVSAILLAIATSASLLGVQEANSSLSFKKGSEALVIAKSCIEEGLYRLQEDASFSTHSLNVGDGSCTIQVSGTSPNYTIVVTATVSFAPSFVKRITVNAVKAGNSISITSWQEQ